MSWKRSSYRIHSSVDRCPCVVFLARLGSLASSGMLLCFGLQFDLDLFLLCQLLVETASLSMVSCMTCLTI